MKLFFSTEPAACPYLPDRHERRLVTALDGADPDRLHDRLMRAGFRRSQGLAYRPACPGCQACVPVRIPVATPEQFGLFQRYLVSRHGASGMATMSWPDYRAMIEDSPVDSLLIEWRRPDTSLIAASLTDRAAGGLSGVYKFFDPDESRRSLGTLAILWHVRRAEELGLPYVYLGYWIAASPKMAYKARFRPLERLTAQGWQALPPAD